MKNLLLFSLLGLVLMTSSCEVESFDPYEGQYRLQTEEVLTCTNYNTTELYTLKVLSETTSSVVVGTTLDDVENTNGVKYLWYINVGSCNYEVTDRSSYSISKFVIDNFDVTITRYNLSENERVIGFHGKIVL